MPRINHDADKSRLVAKYGVKPIARKYRLPDDIPPKKQAEKPKRIKVANKTWLAIHREHLRWKKTADYAKWRYKQFLKQGGTCYYCDEPLGGARINDEHIIPKIRGGDNRRGNLALACWRCNKEKFTKMLSKAERESLKAKNSKKRGTYHKLKEQYPTNNEIALRISDFC